MEKLKSAFIPQRITRMGDGGSSRVRYATMRRLRDELIEKRTLEINTIMDLAKRGEYNIV